MDVQIFFRCCSDNRPLQALVGMDFRSADSSLLRGRSLYGGTEAESVCCDDGRAL